jgi:hypothetical protein
MSARPKRQQHFSGGHLQPGERRYTVDPIHEGFVRGEYEDIIADGRPPYAPNLDAMRPSIYKMIDWGRQLIAREGALDQDKTMRFINAVAGFSNTLVEKYIQDIAQDSMGRQTLIHGSAPSRGPQR